MRTDVPRGTRPSIVAEIPLLREGQWLLELPFQRPLSLNDRDIWQVRFSKIRPWRKAAAALARAQKIPRCKRVTIELFFVPPDRRVRDPINLIPCVKACEDGLVDAGVIPDDRGAWHTSVMPVIMPKGPLRPGGNRFWVVVTAHPDEQAARHYLSQRST